MHNPLATAPRIDLLDALRGLAIAAILLIHASSNFLYVTPLLREDPAWLVSCNQWTHDILFFFFENKASSMFATLMGVTYAIMWTSRQRRGEDFQLRMAWRMLLLMGFGWVNALFFMGGDPLIFYSLAMLIIIPLIRFSDRVLLYFAR